jgi:hypothetical protein
MSFTDWSYLAPAVDWAAVPAEDKLRIIKAMGFVPMWSPHTYECPANFDEDGYICNCVPDPTCFSPPDDVLVVMGETWEERLRAAELREAQ